MTESNKSFAVATGFQGGVTVGFYADTFGELQGKFQEAFGVDGTDILDGLLAKMQAESILGSRTLEQVVSGALDATTVTPTTTASVHPAGDPNGPPPGQTCDPKDPSKTKWVPAGVSQKTKKPYPGFWATP